MSLDRIRDWEVWGRVPLLYPIRVRDVRGGLLEPRGMVEWLFSFFVSCYVVQQMRAALALLRTVLEKIDMF